MVSIHYNRATRPYKYGFLVKTEPKFVGTGTKNGAKDRKEKIWILRARSFIARQKWTACPCCVGQHDQKCEWDPSLLRLVNWYETWQTFGPVAPPWLNVWGGIAPNAPPCPPTLAAPLIWATAIDNWNVIQTSLDISDGHWLNIFVVSAGGTPGTTQFCMILCRVAMFLLATGGTRK